MKSNLRFESIIFFFSFTALFSNSARAQEFYDLNRIEQIRIYFNDPNWRIRLDTAKAGADDYTLADSVVINGKNFKDCGVKFKGNSTYSPNRIKNPLHIKLDYEIDQDYQGYDDIKLSNGWSDNSMIREALGFAILRNYMDAPKCNFAQLYIDDSYYGLMSNCESIDKKFLIKNYFSSIYPFIKCNPESIGAGLGNGSNLEYLGPEVDKYSTRYELESDTGWYALIELMDTLNNAFSQFETIADVDRILWMLAFNNVLVNLDSYTGNFRQNYYLYRNHERLWIPTVWDLNMCFGGFASAGGIAGALNPNSMQTMAFNLHRSESGWPLIQKLLNDSSYYRMYLAHMRTLNQENFLNSDYKTLALGLHQMIDSLVKNDPNHLSTYAHFQNALSANTPGLNGAPQSPGIFPLMDARSNYLKNVISATQPNLKLPQLVTDSTWMGTLQMLTNADNVNQVYVFYRYHGKERFRKLEMFDDGLHGDGAAGDQTYGVGIRLEGAQLEYYLYAENRTAGRFLPERAAHEFFRFDLPLKYASNDEIILNEIMPLNTSGVYNEKGKYKDWIEIYNKTKTPLLLDSLYLSNDNSKPNKWKFPLRSLIKPESYYLVWIDNENADYLQPHASFNLSNSNGFIGIRSGSDWLQTYQYGSAKEDRSYGRCPDLYGNLVETKTATPGFENECLSVSDDLLQEDFSIYPNPGAGMVFFDTEKEFTQLDIHEFHGKLILSQKFQNTMDLHHLNSGIYFISVFDHEGHQIRRKFIKL